MGGPPMSGIETIDGEASTFQIAEWDVVTSDSVRIEHLER